MTKIGLMLTFLISTFVLFSQNIDSTKNENEYPKPYIVDGDTIGGILTIDQLKKVDKDEQLLDMYKDLLSTYKESDDFSISIIDDYENQISVYKVKVNELKQIISDKDIIISKLNRKVSLYEENEKSYEKTIENKDKVIKEKDIIIKNQKKKMIWGGIGAGALLILVTILSIL